MLTLIHAHKCNIYCEPKNNIHGAICLSLPDTTVEELLEKARDYLLNYEEGDIISIKEIKEYDLEELKKQVNYTRLEYTKPWLVIGKAITE